MGKCITSIDLPTTADYTNILVNYIEILASQPAAAPKRASAAARPMPILGAAILRHAQGTAESVA